MNKNQILKMLSKKTLCRVLSDYFYHEYRGGIKGSFDEKGYLLPKGRSCSPTVPLVHPDEWEIVARWFASPKDRYKGAFTLLRILTEELEDISWQPCDFLKHGEFFARVHLKDIIIIDDYEWERTNEQPKIPSEILPKIHHYFNDSVGYKPKLIASYEPSSIFMSLSQRG